LTLGPNLEEESGSDAHGRMKRRGGKGKRGMHPVWTGTIFSLLVTCYYLVAIVFGAFA